MRSPSPSSIARGVVLDRDLSTVHPVNPTRLAGDQGVHRTLLVQLRRRRQGRHPSLGGETKLNYTGPKPPFETLEGYEKYSFLKTPRWKEQPMEVGPLARLLVSYAAGHDDVKELVGMTLGKLNVPVGALFSTLGAPRRAALDAALAMGWLKEFFGELMERVKIHEVSTFNGELWEPKTWPTEREGVGLAEAPRGALAHWIKIHDGEIDNYQLVVPTTWNGSPRDAKEQRSSFEQALIGTPVAKIDEPVEILRTIHSFDPCLACAVHLYDPQGRHLHQVSFE